MRDTAGSAAAPAARLKTRRRGCCVTDRRSLLRGAGRCCTLAVLQTTAFIASSDSVVERKLTPRGNQSAAPQEPHQGPRPGSWRPSLTKHARDDRRLIARYPDRPHSPYET